MTYTQKALDSLKINARHAVTYVDSANVVLLSLAEEILTQSLEGYREEIVGKIEGMKRDENELIGTDSEAGYEKALSDVLSLLQSNDKGGEVTND